MARREFIAGTAATLASGVLCGWSLPGSRKPHNSVGMSICPESRCVPLRARTRQEDHELRFFSTITRFGTPRDVTIDELRIECTFAADEVTSQLCRALAQEDRA